MSHPAPNPQSPQAPVPPVPQQQADPFASGFQPTDHAAAQFAQQQGFNPNAPVGDGFPAPGYGYAPAQPPAQSQGGYPAIPNQPQYQAPQPQAPQYAGQPTGPTYSGLTPEQLAAYGMAPMPSPMPTAQPEGVPVAPGAHDGLWGVPVGQVAQVPDQQGIAQQAAPPGFQAPPPGYGAPPSAMDPVAQLQQQYAALQQQLAAFQQLGFAPASPQGYAPQGDGQQGPPPTPVQPQAPAAPAEPELKRPEKPVRPDDFDPYEAQTDPKSASAKYLAAQSRYVEDLATYAEERDRATERRATEAQQAAVQQHRQAQMEQALVARAQREYGLSPAEAVEFLRYATGEGLNDMAGWVQAFRYNQQVQAASRPAPQRDAQGRFLPQQRQAGYPQAPMAPPQSYPVVPTQAAGAPVPQYVQQGIAQMPGQGFPQVSPYGATGFPPTVAAQHSQYVPAASVEDSIFNEMLATQRALATF